MTKHVPRWSAAVAAVAAVVTITLPSIPASANWFGASWQQGACNTNGNITDNKNVYFDYIDLSSDGTAATNWVRTNLLNPTSLDTFLPATPGPSVDVVMRDRYYTDWCEDSYGIDWTTDGLFGVRGATACYALTSAGRCDQQVVRISNYFFDAHAAAGDRFIVCHEVGHAIGLRHRNHAGCMRNNVDKSDRVYTPHDLGHINSNWGTEPWS